MNSTPTDSSPLELETRLLSTAEDLRSAFLPILVAIEGPRPRPMVLQNRLGIDKSLASRLARAFRTEEPFEMMHHIPAPTGLKIVLNRAERARIAVEACRAAHGSVDRFHALIHETPGGRASLDAAISLSSPSARLRNERNARQAAFKSLSYLLGCQVETATTTIFLQPSADGRHTDVVEVQQRLGMRRIRTAAPISLFGYQTSLTDEENPAPRIETLDGRPADHIRQVILPEYSTDPLPPTIDLYEGNHLSIALDNHTTSLEEPFNFTIGVIVRNAMMRYRTPARSHEWHSYLLRNPCRHLVRDVLVHEDLEFAEMPELVQYLPGSRGTRTERHPGVQGRLDTLDLDSPVESLGYGLDRLGFAEAPRYKALIQDVLARLRWNPDRFRGYRSRLQYPLALVQANWWFKLPEPPAPA